MTSKSIYFCSSFFRPTDAQIYNTMIIIICYGRASEGRNAFRLYLNICHLPISVGYQLRSTVHTRLLIQPFLKAKICYNLWKRRRKETSQQKMMMMRNISSGACTRGCNALTDLVPFHSRRPFFRCGGCFNHFGSVHTGTHSVTVTQSFRRLMFRSWSRLQLHQSAAAAADPLKSDPRSSPSWGVQQCTHRPTPFIPPRPNLMYAQTDLNAAPFFISRRFITDTSIWYIRSKNSSSFTIADRVGFLCPGGHVVGGDWPY